MADRYTRAVLTVIAACLVYLCLVVSRAGTPLAAQVSPPQGATRPGLSPGPAEVVIVGWRSAGQDVAFPVVVRNTVTTAPANDGPTRVVVTGWEDHKGASRSLRQDAGLPVDPSAVARPTRGTERGSAPVREPE